MVNFRIEPYVQEAMLQIILDIIVIIIISTALTFVKFSLVARISIAIGYVVFAMLFHYKVIIQAIIDKHMADYVTEVVSIKKFIDEYSFSGDRLGHSYIRFFYPKEMKVWNYKIKIISKHGQANNLRSVMSFRRMLQFSVLEKQQIEYLQVTYLKRSKILLCVDLIDKTSKITNKRKKLIEKAINFINKSI